MLLNARITAFLFLACRSHLGAGVLILTISFFPQGLILAGTQHGAPIAWPRQARAAACASGHPYELPAKPTSDTNAISESLTALQ